MTDTSEGLTTVRSSGCSSFTTTCICSSSTAAAEKPPRISICLRSCSLPEVAGKAEVDEKVEEKVDVEGNEAFEGKVE